MDEPVDDMKSAIAQAMYDIKPSMIGAIRLADAIADLIDAKIREAVKTDEVEVKRGPGRPKRDAA